MSGNATVPIAAICSVVSCTHPNDAASENTVPKNAMSIVWDSQGYCSSAMIKPHASSHQWLTGSMIDIIIKKVLFVKMLLDILLHLATMRLYRARDELRPARRVVECHVLVLPENVGPGGATSTHITA